MGAAVQALPSLGAGHLARAVGGGGGGVPSPSGGDSLLAGGRPHPGGRGNWANSGARGSDLSWSGGRVLLEARVRVCVCACVWMWMWVRGGGGSNSSFQTGDQPVQ